MFDQICVINSVLKSENYRQSQNSRIFSPVLYQLSYLSGVRIDTLDDPRENTGRRNALRTNRL